ncbi:MAG: hypothetical protein CMJ31_07605 [Phycisphaerae bacterium]|nr:hypothetical protein [Phycisphaerae bacterium]
MPEPTTAGQLRDRLRAQAEAQRAAFAATPGLSADTYQKLADRAEALESALRAAGLSDDDLAPIADHRRTLRDVTRQLDGSASSSVPPPNSAVYAAAIEVTELTAIARSLKDASPVWREAIASHVRAGGSPGAERLALSLAAVLRGSSVKLNLDAAAPVTAFTIDLGGWAASFAFGSIGVDDASALSTSLQTDGRTGMVVMDAGAAVTRAEGGMIRAADDRTLITAVGQRLENLLVEKQPALAAAVNTDHAFAAVAHATIAGLNVASSRLVFCECWRVVNLCDLDDPRIPRVKRFIGAIESSSTAR